jgi:AcrR family transcriptional regulator
MPETQRRTPQQSRARATVDAILTAAAQILETREREEFTAKRVAEVAGVSIGSLYQYFANKQEVLDALAERYGAGVEASLSGEIERSTRLPLREAVRGCIERVVEMHRRNPSLHPTLACEPSPLTPEDMAGFREATRRYLEAHPEAVRDLDPELASVVVTRAALALVHTTAIEEPEWLQHPEFTQEVSELIVRYLAR